MRNKNELKIHTYINKSMNAMNVLMNRFIGFGGFGFKRTTTVVATTVVATTLMYKAYKAYKAYTGHTAHNKRKALQNQYPPAEPFEHKYFKEYDELADDPHAPIPPANSHVRETTPQGDVIMTYDTDRAVFCYYCDKRTVQFKYLEPVSRKYVVEHGCKRFYIDFRKELTKARHKAATMPEATPAVTAKPMSVFAQFKKYSTNSAANKHPAINNDNGLQDRACVLKEQVTRYLYCGRLDDFVDASHAS